MLQFSARPVAITGAGGGIGQRLVARFVEAGATVAPALPMMGISLASALIIAIGKIAISLLSAFAIVYFRFPFKTLVFSGGH